jgi:hypothetical protein
MLDYHLIFHGSERGAVKLNGFSFEFVATKKVKLGVFGFTLILFFKEVLNKKGLLYAGLLLCRKHGINVLFFIGFLMYFG